MERLARERDTLSRHLRQSQEALEEFRELHESELSVAQEREQDLVADNAALRDALASRDEELHKLRDAFDKFLAVREAHWDAPQPQADPAWKANAFEQEYDSEELEQDAFETPYIQAQGKKLLHARQLAIDLAKQLEQATQTAEQIQEQRDAALVLLQARQETIEGLKDDIQHLKHEQLQDIELEAVRQQMQTMRNINLNDLLQHAPVPRQNNTPSDQLSCVLRDIDAQIQQAEVTLKILHAERRTLDPHSPASQQHRTDLTATLHQVQTLLHDREQQLEHLARTAREALEAQARLLDVQTSEKEQLEQALQQAKQQHEESQELLHREQDKTKELTSQLEQLVQGLDHAAQAAPRES